jgi:hypothetical protein
MLCLVIQFQGFQDMRPPKKNFSLCQTLKNLLVLGCEPIILAALQDPVTKVFGLGSSKIAQALHVRKNWRF